MKKTILLSMAVLLFSMTSCLKEGEQSRSGEGQMFYVSQTTEGLKFAYNGDLAITSPQIKAAEADKWYMMSWLWDSKMGFANDFVANASTSDLEALPLAVFHNGLVPSEVAHTALSGFSAINIALTKKYGNYLLFQVSYPKKEGEVATLHLYSDLKLGTSDTDARTIDLRLLKTGTGSGTEKEVSSTFAVKMDALRSLVKFDDSKTTASLPVKYRYYSKTLEKSMETPIIDITIVKEESYGLASYK